MQTPDVAHEWFPDDSRVKTGTRSAHWLPPVIGLVIGGVIYRYWSPGLGILVLTISTLLIAVAALSPGVSQRIHYGMRKFGEFVGISFAYVLLTPLFLFGMSAVRIVSRIRGSDPLGLAPTDTATFWLPSDSDVRKCAYVRCMFATDPPGLKRRSLLLSLVLMLFMGLGLAEVALRIWGLGTPVLYVNDPICGYLPAPYQDVRRYDGRVKINGFGMRSPDFELPKPERTLRLFFIGDSTLYGGSYVDQSQLYSHLVESRLGAELGGQKVEVLNMGVNAWGPFHKLGYVKKYGTFNAEIAVICLPIGDIYRPLHQLEVGGPLFLATHAPKLALEELWNFAKGRSLPVLRRFLPGFEAQLEIHSDQQRAVGVAKYRELVKELQANGCEVYVEILPTRTAGTTPNVPVQESHDVRELQRAIGPDVSCSYPEGIFIEKGAPQDLYRDEAHLDDVGHAMYAEYLVSRLLDPCREIVARRTAALNPDTVARKSGQNQRRQEAP